jgi:hypothetical protein
MGYGRYSGAGGKLIYEKNQKQKSRDTVSLIPFEPRRLVLYEDKAALSPLTADSLTVCQTTRTIRVKKH